MDSSHEAPSRTTTRKLPPDLVLAALHVMHRMPVSQPATMSARIPSGGL